MGRTIPSYRIATEMERKQMENIQAKFDKKDRKRNLMKCFLIHDISNSAGSNACRPILIHPILTSLVSEQYQAKKLESSAVRTEK